MGSQSIVAGRGSVVLAADATKLEKGLEAAKAKFAGWAKDVALLGAGITAAGAFITAPFLKGLQVFSDFGTEAVASMRMTGLGFRELEDVMRGTRTSADSLVPAMAHMNQLIAEAANGSAEANTKLERLGLSLDELQASSVGDRFMRIADAINRMGDAGARVAAQRGVFGRGGLDVNISGGSAGINERAARAAQIGGVRTEADVVAAKAYNEAMREMQQAVTGVWMALGRGAAPAMTEFLNIVTDLIIKVRTWLDSNRELLEVIFRVGDKVALVAGVVFGLAAVIQGAAFAFGFLSGAVAITQGVLAALWAVTVFAATGFGILTLASYAVSAAVWVYNAATTVGHILTWAWVPILAAVAIAFSAIPIAIGLVVGGIVLFVGYMLWSRGIIQAVWNAIYERISGVVSASLNLIVRMAGVLKSALGGAWEWVKSLFSGSSGGFLSEAFAFWADAAMAAVRVVTGAFTTFVTHIGTAIGKTVENFGTLFSGLVETAGTAFGGIKDAITSGDWALAWEIAKATAKLAWAQIMAFIEPTWNIWKDTASDIWRDISSKFVDTMEKAWTKIKAMFAVGWAEFRASAWEAAASAAEALGDTETARRMRVTAASERRLGQAQANRFQFVGDREAQERASQDISDWFTEMALRVERDTAAESGNTEEVARLQGQLDSVAMEAWFAARIAEVNRQMGSVETGGGVGESAAGKFKVAGGFNAAALMGALGSFGGETPQERAARLLQEANRIAQRAVDLAQQQVREISRLVFTAS